MTFELPTVSIDVYFIRHKAGTFLMYTWMICISVTASDVLREISDV